MNTHKSTFKTIAVLVLMITLTSCKKEVKGCTDATADNYKIEANVDDASCNFHGNLVNWYDVETRDSLTANNVTSVSVFVDGELVNNFITVFTIWSSEPECSTSGIGNWIAMQNTKSKSISLVAKALDSTNTEVRQWSESLNIESGKCELYKIKW